MGHNEGGGGAWRQQVGCNEGGGGVHGGNKWVVMRGGGGCMEATLTEIIKSLLPS